MQVAATFTRTIPQCAHSKSECARRHKPTPGRGVTQSSAIRQKTFHQGEARFTLKRSVARGYVPARSLSCEIIASDLIPARNSTVLVIGATGGVGQLTTAKLLERGYKVRAFVRDATKAETVLGTAEGLEFVTGEAKNAATLAGVAEGVEAVVCCTGTTAFPSARWEGNNGPKNTDYLAVTNVIQAVQASSPKLKRFVLVSSIGVTRTDVMPFLLLNAFGVLHYKGLAENVLKDSGIPYTILRPGRLTDGPYTSYDLNTLLKATSGTKRAVQLGCGDTLLPEATSRIVCAEACVQVLGLEATAGEAFEIGSVEGDGPEENIDKWAELFAKAKADFQLS